jgi:hypothetical protein
MEQFFGGEGAVLGSLLRVFLPVQQASFPNAYITPQNPRKNLAKILLRQLLNTDTVFVRTVYLSCRPGFR